MKDFDEKKIFEKGCFLPVWGEDTSETKPSNQAQACPNQNKDLNTLLRELDEIKQRIETIREKEWYLAKLLYFHENNFAK